MQIQAGQRAIAAMSRLKYEMQTGKPMPLLDDGDVDVEQWNSALERCKAAHGTDSWWGRAGLALACSAGVMTMVVLGFSAGGRHHGC